MMIVINFHNFISSIIRRQSEWRVKKFRMLKRDYLIKKWKILKIWIVKWLDEIMFDFN